MILPDADTLLLFMTAAPGTAFRRVLTDDSDLAERKASL